MSGLKFEVEKEYRSRNGDIWFVVYTKSPDSTYPIIARRDDDGNLAVFTVDGRYSHEYSEHPNDLISEHRKLRDIWVNEYGDSAYRDTVYPTEEGARGSADVQRAARIAVHYREVPKS